LNKTEIFTTVEALINRVNSLEHKLCSILRSVSFPSEGPKHLAEINIKIYKALLRILIGIKKNVQEDNISVEEADEILEKIARKPIAFARWMRFIESSTMESTPLAIVKPLERLTQAISFDARLIIRPQSDFTYETKQRREHLIRDLLEELVEDLEGIVSLYNLPDISHETIFGEHPKHIVILNFPSTIKNDIFFHAAFAHELGHFIFKSEELTKILGRVTDESENEIHRSIVKELEKSGKTVDKDKLQKDPDYHRLKVEINEITTSWYEELASDILGAFLVGPASLLAAIGMSIAGKFPLDYQPEHPAFKRYPQFKLYPSLKKRVRVTLTILESESYLDFKGISYSASWNDKKIQKEMITRFKEEITFWENLSKQEKPLKPIYQLIENIVDKAIKKLRDKIKEPPKEYFYNSRKFKKQVPELCLKIQKDILPCEISSGKGRKEDSEPADWRSILNSGWIYAINKHKLPKDYNEYQLEKGKFFDRKREDAEFILRAVEISEIHQRFHGEKESIGKVLADEP
jgi:hypothetical protein